MPYYAGRKLDEENLKDTYGAEVRQNVSGMGAAAPGTPATAGDAGPAAGRFVSFGQMFGLNKPQAQQMANTLTAGAEKKGSDVMKETEAAEGAFGKQVDKGTNKFGTKTTPVQPKSAAQGGVFNQQTYAQAKGARQNVPARPGALTQQEIQARGQQGYTGPTDLAGSVGETGWQGMLDRARKASTAANQLTTQEGRQTALQEQYGNAGAGYGTSMGGPSSYGSRMDAALAGVAGADQFKRTAEKYGGLAAGLQDRNAASADVAANAARTSGNSAARYRGLYDALMQDKAAKDAAAAQEKADLAVGLAPTQGAAQIKQPRDKNAQGEQLMWVPQASIRQDSGMNDVQSNEVWNMMTPEEQEAYRNGEYDADWLWAKYNSRDTSFKWPWE